ncbi:MAG: hypothetical protein AB1772_04560 [Candidatus Zixiibacteriota bacterium]
MAAGIPRVDCYIGSFHRPLQEPWLEAQGFGKGLILFAIPSHGIIFKCMAKGDPVDLEFGAFFALLRFVQTSLAAQKITAVRVHSSCPEFVFAILNDGPQLKARRGRRKVLNEYQSRVDTELVFIQPRQNKVWAAPENFPCTPQNQPPPLRPQRTGRPRVRFCPIQKGIVL